MLIDFLLRQQCVIRPWVRLEEGEDVYGEAQERACRLQGGRGLGNGGVRTDGVADQETAQALMFCRGEIIPPRSLVECEGRTYIVMRCGRARGLGQEHLEVLLQ